MENGFYTCANLTEQSTIKLNNILKKFNIQPKLDFPYHSTIIASDVKPKTNKIYKYKIKVNSIKLDYLGENS